MCNCPYRGLRPRTDCKKPARLAVALHCGLDQALLNAPGERLRQAPHSSGLSRTKPASKAPGAPGTRSGHLPATRLSVASQEYRLPEQCANKRSSTQNVSAPVRTQPVMGEQQLLPDNAECPNHPTQKEKRHKPKECRRRPLCSAVV